MSDDYEKLKTLLFKDEIADLAAFRQLLNDDDALAQKLSLVLEQASDLTLKNNPSFQDKFTSSKPEHYLNALKRDPKGLTALLTPIISPVIRSAVIQSMRRFISEINNTLEQGLSLKYMKWRWKAFRSGVPLSEIVFENTIQYQVQQLFLIDKETGLLVEYAGQESDLIQDKEAMSAMLTAIQDFVSDSLHTDTGTLSAAELGDDLLWVFPGNKFNLAALIKGAPSGRLRIQLADLLSHVHLKYGLDFEDQNLWNNHLAARHDLSEHLIQKKIQSEKKLTLWPWLIILTLVIAWFSYSRYQKNKNTTNKLNQLKNIPGLVVTDITSKDNRYFVTGFKDPLSVVSHLNDVTFNTVSFYSLDDSLIEKRANQYINQANINTSFKQGTITLSGERSKDSQNDWHHLTLLPGINQVINNTTAHDPKDLSSRLQQFTSSYPPPKGVELSANGNQINASGMTPATLWNQYLSRLKQSFPDINSQQLKPVPNRASLVEQINNQAVLIHSLEQLSDQNKKQILKIVEWDNQINQFYEKGQLTLHARSDCQGSIEESLLNNQKRLTMVHDFLSESNSTLALSDSVNEACESLNQQINPKKIGVWFEKQ
ncbi:hypothetical protein [Marinicella rhabdoformis]|uniref:hypothetical protein n=1 Tax=Marinicella rhabdoformis TaxID=2580566 RepID=UPI0012AEC2B8|nr:hypothetical protein [Marinicella rhabdoformis]